MASKDKLQGSFGSLSDTLSVRFDPSFPPNVSSRWLAVMAHAAAVAHRSGDWIALPPDSAAYDPVIAGLDDATHMLVVATTSQARLSALDAGDAALDGLEALLGNPPNMTDMA